MANMFDENGNYNKTEWKPGDRITAGKLNKIEESLEAINNNDIERHKEADERLDALEEQNEAVEERFDELEDLVADNKSEVEVLIYDNNVKMDRLETKLDDGIDTVEAIAHTVDDKIADADASMKAQVAEAEDIVDQGKADMEAMVAEVEADLEGLHAKDEELSEQLTHITQLKESINFEGETIKILGTHHLKKTGEIQLDNPVTSITAKYSLLLENIENLTIDFARNSKLIIDLDNDENPTAILMKNCKNVIIKNLFVEGNNIDSLDEHQLNNGNGVYMVECVNCKVENSYFKNTPGGVYILNSTDCVVDKCTHDIDHTLQTYPIKKSCGSFIIISSNGCTIMNSYSYGGTGDGNIFLGGGYGQVNCKVINCNIYNHSKLDNNKTINYKSAQGICVDGNNKNCVVQDCYIYGFAIGIDVKNYSYNTKVINNVCVNNEIGITFRPGDQGLDGPDIFGGLISENNISVNGGNGLGQNYPFYSNIIAVNNPIGIMLHETTDILVSNNVIKNDPSVSKDFYGLLVCNEKKYNADKNQQGILITGNMFNNNTSRHESFGRSAKPAILMKGSNTMGAVSISNNHFTPYFNNESFIGNVIDIDYKCEIFKIDGNTFGRIKGNNHIVSVKSVSRLFFTKNNFTYNSGVLNTDASVCTITDNVIGPQIWNVSTPSLLIDSNGFINISNNTYNGGKEGTETGFISCTNENAIVSVMNNVLFLGYAQTSNAINIVSSNKKVVSNVGARAGATIIDIN